MAKSRHVRVQLASCMWWLGSDAYAPGTNLSGGPPSFITSVPWPLITTRSSLGVCQCIGTRQPEANFSSAYEASERGSPRSIVAVTQLGMLGIVTNFIVCGLTPTECRSSLARPAVAVVAMRPTMTSSAPI